MTSHSPESRASASDDPHASPVEMGWVKGTVPVPGPKWKGTWTKAAGTHVGPPPVSDSPLVQATTEFSSKGRHGVPGSASCAGE